MKTINESFSDSEMKQLKKMKGKLSWRDFIMRKDLILYNTDNPFKYGLEDDLNGNV